MSDEYLEFQPSEYQVRNFAGYEQLAAQLARLDKTNELLEKILHRLEKSTKI